MENETVGIDVGVLVDKLNNFQSSDEIAEFLRGEGIRATMFDSKSCAISKWVSREAGVPVSTGTALLHTWDPNETAYRKIMGKEFPLSSAAKAFVTNFDGGMYQDLVDPSQPYLA